VTDVDIDVVVVGGGPAGCTAAAMAARAGLRVALFEAGTHPRAHVGESLLPGIIPILADIDALAAVEAAGFGRKTGSTLWGWGKTPRWDLWFADSDEYDHAWLVERARFDEILFDAARRAGATLHERCVVDEPCWAGDRVVGVRWRARDAVETSSMHARVVIDATGQSAMIGRALALREMIPGLRHQAMWAHFAGAGRLPAPRREQALFVAEADQWWWMFPLGDELTSIGVVQLDAAERRSAPRPDFDGELSRCRELMDVLGRAAHRISAVRHERDWSWRMRDVAGPGWMAVGDAAGFIDPVLSTGVMLALHSGWHAGRTAVAMIGEGGDENEALAAYRTHHLGAFDDLLRMVRFYYQQNLHRDDYFWESKRILLQEDTALRPQKAFVVLTSGLVQNLALDDVRASTQRRREDRSASDRAPDLDSAELGSPSDPDTLGFLCFHLRRPPTDETEPQDGPDRGTSLFVMVEPADPAAPTLVRTRNFHVNGIAPRHGNDPISVPEVGDVLRWVADRIVALDTQDESLAQFWRRVREPLGPHLRAAPHGFALVRVFGE
jgi:flavin-dependent dehydrogenase